MARCDENWELEPDYAVSELARLLASLFTEWICLFPEVNVWTPESAGAQARMAERYCLPLLENLLYPRYAAVFNIAQGLSQIEGHPFHTLYDVTITYRVYDTDGKLLIEHVPTLLDLLSSAYRIRILINVTRRNLSRIPSKRSRLERYVERMWAFKDSVITDILQQEIVFEDTPMTQPRLFENLITPFLGTSISSHVPSSAHNVPNECLA